MYRAIYTRKGMHFTTAPASFLETLIRAQRIAIRGRGVVITRN